MADALNDKQEREAVAAAEKNRELIVATYEDLRSRIDKISGDLTAETKADINNITTELDKLGIKEYDQISPEDWEIVKGIEQKIAELEADFSTRASSENKSEPAAGDAKAAAEKEKSEAREKILQQLDAALSYLKNMPAADQTDQIKWIIRSVEDAKSQAATSADLKFEISIDNHSQREGIPVDDLMEALESIVKTKGVEASEQARLKSIIETLQTNSRGYFELHPDMQGDKQHWRTELEAVLASLDIRSTGNADSDYKLAMEAMNKRRELVLPDDKAAEAIPSAEAPAVEQKPVEKAEPLQLEHKPESAGELEVAEPKEIIKSEKKQGRKWEKMVLAGMEEEVKRRAMTEAREKVNAMLDKKRNKNVLTRSLVRLGEKGYLAKYYKEAKAAIEKNKNLLAEIQAGIGASEVASYDLDKSYEIQDAVVEGFMKEVVDADEKGEVVCDAEVNLVISQLFADYATSKMTRVEFDEEVDDRVIAFLKEKGYNFGAADAKSGEGSIYASNLFAMAESYRQQFENQVDRAVGEFGEDQAENCRRQLEAEIKLDLAMVPIELGNIKAGMKGGKSEASVKWYEKMIESVQNCKYLGDYGKDAAAVLANPVLYGVVAGAAGSLLGKGISRGAATVGLATVAGVAPWLTPLIVGAGFGGIFTGARKLVELKNDRILDTDRDVLGSEVADDAVRTKKIRQFGYDIKRAEDLQETLQALMNKEDLSEEDKKAVADVMARLEVEKEKSVDLIGVTEEEGQKHKTKLVAMTDLKVRLKELNEKFNLSADDQEMRALIDELKAELSGNIEQNDADFESFKRKERNKSALFGACMGVAAGAVGQWAVGEAKDLFAIGKEYLGYAPSVNAMPRMESALEHLWHLMKGDTASTSHRALEHLALSGGQLLDRDGRAVVEHLAFDKSTGKLSAAAIEELKNQGVIANETGTSITETSSVASKLQEGLAKNARADWHDEPGKKLSSFFKRLIEHEGKQQMFYLDKDASGNVIVDASKILDNLSANAREAVKEFGMNPDGSVDTKLAGLRDQLIDWASKGELSKHIKVAIFPTDADNKAGLSYLTESADGSGKINLGSAVSKLFGAKDSLQDGHIPFRFGELRIVDDSGASHVLATITGKDIDPTVMSQTVTNHYNYTFDKINKVPDVAADWDVPPVLPFNPRRPLERPGKRNSNEAAGGGDSPTGGTGEARPDAGTETAPDANHIPDNLPWAATGEGNPFVTEPIELEPLDENEVPVAPWDLEGAVAQTGAATNETVELNRTERPTIEELIKQVPLNRGELRSYQKAITRDWLNNLTVDEIDSIRKNKKQRELFNKVVERSYYKEGTKDFQDSEAEKAFKKLQDKFATGASKDIFQVAAPGQAETPDVTVLDTKNEVIS